MNNEEQILSLLGQLATDMSSVKADVSTLKTDVSTLKTDVSTLTKKVDDLTVRVDRVENHVILIENEHGKHLSALHDGYVQHSDQLTRIEREVTRHNDIILRRVK